MKILTWNINHRISKKKIPREMAEALASLSPDIIVLTEYVEGPSHNQFLADLKSEGFSYWRLSEYKERQNRIFIASRMPLGDGNSKAPTDIIEAVPCNVLHVTIPQIELNVLGLRMPLPMNPQQKKEWWDWVTTTARKSQKNRFIILGDFNTELTSKGPNGAVRLLNLAENGWQHASPVTGGSWWLCRDDIIYEHRLDHAFFSKHFTLRSSEYIIENGKYIFAKKPGAMSDHAVLLVDVDIKL
jgi:endonuclease/exonuclease/phosphatase family metal-dependent hydrolase